jgi:hypothetical protein
MMQMAAVRLTALIHPRVSIAKIVNPGKRYVKHDPAEYLFRFEYKYSSIMRKGTNDMRRMIPGHQPDQARLDRIPPANDNAISVYLFIYALAGFLSPALLII